jgi:plasmid stabilization system protein ParE
MNGAFAPGANAKAQRWARQLRTAVLDQLGIVPKAFPLAPENDEFSEEIRQMSVGRYRVLYTIKGDRVHVLHVTGAYFATPESQADE